MNNLTAKNRNYREQSLMHDFTADYKKSFLMFRLLIVILGILMSVYLIIIAVPNKPLYTPPFFGRPAGELGVAAIRLIALGLIGYLLFLGRNSLRMLRSSSPAIICTKEGLFIEELMSKGALPWSAISDIKGQNIDGPFVAVKQQSILIVSASWHKFAKKRLFGVPVSPRYLLKGFTASAREILDAIESYREADRR